jgi:hypothetical protein
MDVPESVRVHQRCDGLRAAALIVLLACVTAWSSAHASNASNAFSFDDGIMGATCSDYDLATGLAWRNKAGDWRDADGKQQGDRAFGAVFLAPKSGETTVDFDVSGIVAAGSRDRRNEVGVLIRSLGNERGVATFNSREADDPVVRPMLVLSYAKGERVVVPAAADTQIACSTQKSLGTKKILQVGPGSNILVRFTIRPSPSTSLVPVKAVVRLTLVRQTSRRGSYGAFALDPPLRGDATPQAGIAAGYPNSRALAQDPAVLLVEDFESGSWRSHWSQVGTTPTFDTTSSDAQLKFEPLDGKALEVEIPKGKKLGLNVTYDFRDKLRSEPDEIYFRYYLRLADDWHPTASGGKLPGIAGTYNRAGWGGRKPDGTNGWSMRGGFSKEIPEHRPLGGDTPIGTYAYHVDQEGKYGEFWNWSQGRPTALERNRWYCIEQYFRVNTPGKNDGALMAWVDGVKLFSRSNIRVRDVDSLHIEQVWMNVYHGGTVAAPQDLHMFIDDVVIARRYIGPRASDLSHEQKAAARR